MSQSLVQNLIHLTFSTKERRPLIAPEIQGDLSGYLVGIFRNWDSPSIIVNCVEDRAHVLFSLSRNHALKTIVEDVKKGSSMDQDPGTAIPDVLLAGGVWTVSQSNVDRVKRYIASQQEHHRKVSFEDEFRESLRRHGVEWDERYVWD